MKTNHISIKNMINIRRKNIPPLIVYNVNSQINNCVHIDSLIKKYKIY